MIRAALLLLVCSGCATTWTVTRLTGNHLEWEEQERDQAVPLEGLEEHLRLEVRLAPLPDDDLTPQQRQQLQRPATQPAAGRFYIRCEAGQEGKATVYRAAWMRGPKWKWVTGLAFVAEALVGGLYLGAGETTAQKAFGVYAAADAVGTAILFLLPRRAVYRHFESTSYVFLRNDCPEGLTLVLSGGMQLPVNARGHVSDAGLTALQERVALAGESVTVRVAGHESVLALDEAKRCVWARRRQLRGAEDVCRGVAVSDAPELVKLYVDVEAPVGTFSAPPPSPPAGARSPTP